jgi:hypothetical protein
MNKEIFNDILNESYPIEHQDAVALALKSFDAWIDLIIWDLLEIQTYVSLRNEPKQQEIFQHRFETLQEDIKILHNQLGVLDPLAHKKMVSLVGYLYETMELLHEDEIQQLKPLMDEYELIQASKIWNKLSSEQKDELLHRIDIKTEIEFDENGVSLKD